MNANSAPKIESLECEWIPAKERSAKLLVVLHGRGDSSEGFRWLPEAFGFTALNYLLVNAPDEYFGGRSWYGLPPDQKPGVLRSRDSLDQLFGELIQAGYEPGDMGLFGFSQGCLMTLEWGVRSALKLSAYVGVSGYCLDPEALLSERNLERDTSAWIITHGRQDEALPYATTQQQIEELARGGFALRFETYDKGHTIDPYDELPLLREFVQAKLDVH
ncbi:MAG: phospholipase/carboxylesterase [Planctomycetota bacterium]|jgi:phospholipase/carboxylesterase